MKSLLLASAMIFAAPAVAQTAAAPTSTNTAQPPAAAATTAPAQAPQPATDAPVTQGAGTATTRSPAPAQATQPTTETPAAEGAGTTTTTTPAPAGNPADAVATVVSTDWAKYDADKNDNLSKAEFSAWMTALREANPAQKAQVKDVASWTTSAFTQADKDKSGSVTKPELEGFLKG